MLFQRDTYNYLSNTVPYPDLYEVLITAVNILVYPNINFNIIKIILLILKSTIKIGEFLYSMFTSG